MTNVNLPIKRNDASTLKERMSANAWENILPARYMLKDEDGEFKESKEEVFERVAKNIALAEAAYADEDIYINHDHIKPDHPRRQELIDEVFFKSSVPSKNDPDPDTTADEVLLTEKNVKYVSYDAIYEDLPYSVQSLVASYANDFENLMSYLKFMPNTPTIMNAGGELQQLSACFVDSPKDDIEDIHDTAKEAAKIFQSGGGMGYGFWKLRPYGDKVGSTGGISSGPITFMRTYDQMCFVPGTSVLTPRGNKNIENIQKGESVIDENGDERIVTETMERFVDEDVVELEFQHRNDSTKTTEEHPYRVVENNELVWKDAGDVEEGDLVLLGEKNAGDSVDVGEEIDIREFCSGYFAEVDGGVAVDRTYYGANKGKSPESINPIVGSTKFAKLAGWYLAEGSIRYQRGIPSTVAFTLHLEQKDAAEEIEKCIEEFGLEPRHSTDEERTTRHVKVDSSSFAEFVEGVFGKGAHDKQIPDLFWNATPELKSHLLSTLFKGDGRIDKKNDGKSQRAILKLVNEDIIDFAYYSGIECGVRFGKYYEEYKDKSDTYCIGASVSTAIGTPLEKLFDDTPEDFHPRDNTKEWKGRQLAKVTGVSTVQYDGPVYNIEVEETHTYVANDVVVHNCETIAQGGARRGAQMGIMRVSHPDVIQFIHAKNKDVSLAHCLRLDDPDDFTHTSFKEALEEARELIDDEGRVPKHLRNAVEGHLSNFNISVGVTDTFMEAVKNNEEYTFTNPRTEEPHIATKETVELYEMFDLGEHVEEGEVLSVPANEIWEHMVQGAHENGEPGVIYLERANKEHSFDVEEHPDHQILATNPCGEQPLEEYEACNLGHINLSTIVKEDNPDWRTWIGDEDIEDMEYEAQQFLRESVDWEELDRRIRLCTRFLENVVTMSDFPISEIEEKVANMRKIGLGIMGLAQMFIQMGVRYGSDHGDEIARQLMMHINHQSKEASRYLAKERGTFAEWGDSKYADPVQYEEWFEKQTGEDAEDWEDGFPIRNHNTTTIAPTGTTSMLGNTSGGCEPIYSVANYKNVSDDVQGDEMLVEFDDYFIRTLRANNLSVTPVKEEAKEQMENNEFDGVEGLSSVPDEIGELFVTTGDLSAKEHASIQCALQEGVDSAISKTVNAPNESTVADAKEVFEYIYDHGGKGVTYYRDGTRSKQVLTTRAQNTEFADNEDEEEFVDEYLQEEYDISLGDIEGYYGEYSESTGESKSGSDTESRPRERPDTLLSESHRISTGVGNMYVNIGYNENGPFEAFVNIGKSGGFTQSHTEAIGRLISLHLRSGGSVEDVIEQLDGIRGPNVAWDDGEQVNSIPDGVALALERFIEDKEKRSDAEDIIEEAEDSEKKTDGGSISTIVKNGENPSCPECGAMKEIQEGCMKCPSCGWSKC